MADKRLPPYAMEREKELREIKKIEDRIELMTQKLIEKTPVRFKIRDLTHDFFASLIVGLIIIFKGNLDRIPEIMTMTHLFFVVLSTLIVLTGAIYFGSYIHVSDKKNWPFFNVWIKRVISNYSIALIVSVYLIYVFGFDALLINGLGV